MPRLAERPSCHARDVLTTPTRTARAAAACALTVLAVAGCSDEEETPDATSAPTVSVTPTSDAGAASGTPSATPTPDDAQAITLTVSGGEISGDTGRVDVRTGTRVRLTVTSDAPDEVHVHGVELTRSVSPGQATQIEFVADRAGTSEVELHDAGTVLTRLQVQ